MTTVEKLIREIQKLGKGAVTSYISLSKSLGWNCKGGKVLRREILQKKPEIFEIFREGRMSKIRIIGDPKELDSPLLNRKVRKNDGVRPGSAKKEVSVDNVLDHIVAVKEKKFKATKNVHEDKTVLSEDVKVLDEQVADVKELEEASVRSESFDEDSFFNE